MVQVLAGVTLSLPTTVAFTILFGVVVLGVLLGELVMVWAGALAATVILHLVGEAAAGALLGVGTILGGLIMVL